MDRDYLTVSEVTETLGCNRRTVLRWIAQGKFRATKFPGAMGWRIDRESFEGYVSGLRVDYAARRELQNGEGS